MLVGERVVLRAEQRADVERAHAELGGDYAVHAVADDTPWRPESLEAALARWDKRQSEPEDPKTVRFTVADRGDPDLAWVGDAQLWGVHEHQGTAHVGLVLAAAARGRGLGTDVVRVLCHYAFRVLDLRRLGVETLATNGAMLGAARSAGFREEGRLRESAYVLGDLVDEVHLGLLRREWSASRPDAARRDRGAEGPGQVTP